MVNLRSIANLSVASLARSMDLRYWLRRLSSTSRLPLSSRHTLAQMAADNANAPEPFRATALWLEVSRRFGREFFMSGVDAAEAQYYNVRFFGYSPGDPRLYEYLLYTYYQLVRARDRLDLVTRAPATCPVGPGLAVEFDGLLVSLDQLLSIDDFYNMLEAKPEIESEPAVIVDLGAGWGRLGYVVHRANPRATYVVLDLPETLLISSTYLPRLLPQAKAMTYEAGASHDSLDRCDLMGASLWFLGTQHITKLANGSVDLFVNVASFQEMTRRQVQQYFDYIDTKGQGGGLYVRQLWHGSTHAHADGEIEGFEEYPFPEHWRRLFVRSSRFSHRFFEAAFSL